MTHLRRLLALFFLVCAAHAIADEPPRLVVQTNHPRTNGRIAVSPDHQFLVSADDDGTVKIWGVSNGLLLRTLELEIGINQIGFDPSGRLVVAGREKVSFIDPALGTEVGSLQVDRPLCTTFDFAGSTLVTGDTAATVNSWDSAGQKQKTLATLKEVVRAVRVSPDAKILAVLTQDGILTLFSLPTAKKLGAVPGFIISSSLDFSEDSKLLAAVTTSGVKVLQVSSRKVVQTLPGSFGVAPVATFGSKSNLYFRTTDGISEFDAMTGHSVSSSLLGNTASMDFRVLGDRSLAVRTAGDDAIELYSLSNASLVQSFRGVTGAVTAVASARSYCASGSDDGWVRLWDSGTGRSLGSAKAGGSVSGLAFTRDGSHLLSADSAGIIREWSVPALRPEKGIQVGGLPLLAIAASPSTSKVAVIDYKGTLLVGEIDGTLTEVTSLGERNRALAFAPDGQTIAAGSGTGDIALVSSSGKAPSFINGAHRGTVTFLGFSKDGRTLISGGLDGAVKTWAIGAPLAKSTVQLASSVFSGSMSPDGNTAAIGGWVQPVTLIDLGTGEKKAELPADSRNGRAVAYAGGGSKLITGGRDGAVTLWDLKKTALTLRRYGIGEHDWVVVDEKGRFDGTDTGLKALHWVQDNKPLPLEAFFEQFQVPNLYSSRTGFKADPTVKDPPKPPPTPKIDITKKILPPPSVRITTPTSDQSVGEEQATIEVTATDEGGGVDQISLFQNGKLVSNAQRELVELSRSQGKTISKKFAVLLAPGENVFRATAYNKDRTEGASPKEVRLTLQAAEAGSTLYVLSIGINDYVNDNYDLTFAKPDALAFATDIKTKGAGIYKSIVVEQIVDKLATRANIEAAFARITANAKPGDVFIFFYSGHGLVTEPEDGTQGEFYIVTSDVKKMLGSDDLVKLGLPAKRLRELCMTVPAQKQLIIFDACYSGGAVAAFQSRGAAEEKAIHQLSRSTGVAVMAAASPDQTATELKALGHGVFTYAILKGLSGEAAPGTGSRKVTVGALFAYLNDMVPELTKQYRGKAQFPNTFLSGQDFPIAITKG